MDLAGKLQLKSRQSMAIVAQPDGLRFDLGDDHPVASSAAEADAVIAFCRNRGELDKTLGVQPVRQVALDDVWSALRLRPA